METSSYDADGRLVQHVTPEGTLGYNYDRSGRQIRTWTQNNLSPTTETKYTYDVLGRMIAVTAARRNGMLTSEPATQYYFDHSGNMDLIRLPNEVVTDHEYDSQNRLVAITQFKDETGGANTFDPGDRKIAEYDYDLREDGKRTQATEVLYNASGNPSSTTQLDWLYDELGRLVSEVRDRLLSNDPLDYIARYAFDLSGNRIRHQVDNGATGDAISVYLNDTRRFTPDETTTYTYDANDRLWREVKDVMGTDATTFYEYGSGVDWNTGFAGQATQQTRKVSYQNIHATPPATGHTSDTRHEYNLQGRQSVVHFDSDHDGQYDNERTLTYTYNSQGIRVQSTDGTETPGSGPKTLYHVDAQNPTGYAQVLEQGVDANGNGLQATEITTTYTLGHDVISQAAVGSASLFLLYDGHGSTRALLNMAAQIVTNLSVLQVFDYDAYGNLLNMSANQAATSLLYSGEFTDVATGQQYLRARFYDPATGRFNRLDDFAGNSSDPQSLHKYAYVHGDPVQGIDPNGLEFTISGVTSSIGNMLSVGSRILSGVNTARRFADNAAAALEIISTIRSLFDGSMLRLIRKEILGRISQWGVVPSHFQTALLLRPDFYQAAGKAIANNLFEIGMRIATAQGAKVVEYLNTIPASRFYWVIYMPTPAESQVPNPTGSVRVPGLRILDRQVKLQFGGYTGRLFGLGFDVKREWQSQFFRIDYHRPHAGNWVLEEDGFEFNVHTPRFERDSVRG